MSLGEDESPGPASPSLVSILVPVYNVERYLEETVRSLLAQTHPDIEVLLLDDGSQDASLAVAQQLEEADARVRVLPSDGVNRGVVATRNRLLRHARGAYIAWNDSDDVSAPQRIERQVRFLQKNPRFAAVATGIVYADESLVPDRVESYPADPQRQRTDPVLCCATLLARRQAALDAGPFREVFRGGGEDGDWILRMTDRHEVTNIPDLLYTYRRHEGSLTHNSHNWALTVRLGVLARLAARMRRSGQPDPVDALDPARLSSQLAACTFLDNPLLAPDEIMTALSHRLPDEAPALSVLIYEPIDAGRLPALMALLAQQSFASFEVLVTAASDGSETMRRLADTATFPCRIIATDEEGRAKRERLLREARGRYAFCLESHGGGLRPWALYNVMDRTLRSGCLTREAQPERVRRLQLRAADLTSGAHDRICIETGAAVTLLDDDAGPTRTCPALQAPKDASTFAHMLFRARAVYRNLGAIGVARAVAKHVRRIGAHIPGRLRASRAA